jgi:DNA-binding CsgD family transcriptional regulator
MSLTPIAYNRKAMEILAFPQRPEDWRRPAAALARQIGVRLAPKSSGGMRTFVPEFKSGNRTYLCRAVGVGADCVGTIFTSGASTLLLLERSEPPSSFRSQIACDKFGLSQRERQMVELLVKGMTTKEIAVSLRLSPNTVKSFLRLIMAKMSVSTRAGVVGKLVESNRS